MVISSQRVIQNICRINLSYVLFYQTYLVHVNILYCHMRPKKSVIFLKSTKFERIKIQIYLKLLLYTFEGVWKEKDEFHIEICQ